MKASILNNDIHIVLEQREEWNMDPPKSVSDMVR